MEGVVERRPFGRGGGYRWTLFIFSLSTLSCFVGAAVNPTDLNALKALSSAWDANKLRWTTGDPCLNKWRGVICDDTNTRVLNLTLSSFGIDGTIPAAIGSFSGLLSLDLSFNPSLRGVIPPEIGRLTSLLELSIQECALTGPIPPELGNLTNLIFLALNNNKLTGEIPYFIGGLQKLYWFDVASNYLTGRLPVSSMNAEGIGLDTMIACGHFHLNNNSFTGGIPSELGAPPNGNSTKLTKLKHLLLESNQLTGTIPDSLANLKALEILSLSNNQLSGTIPASLTLLVTASNSSLQQLLLGHNQFIGTIPDLTPAPGIAALGQLLVVDFSYNSFDPQPFPAWPQYASNITTLYMEKTNLIGNVSEAILSHPKLQTLRARNNSLNGTLFIPASIGPNLKVVSLQSNQFDNIVRRTPLSGSLSNVDFQLFGNPICDPNDPLRPQIACTSGSDSLQNWTIPGTCSTNKTCSAGLTFNTGLMDSCNCVDPFQVLLQCRRPTFSRFTNELMENLRSSLWRELNLTSMQQVMVEKANFTFDGRALISINFFSSSGLMSPDEVTISNITHSLSTQLLKLPGFKPYILVAVEPPKDVSSGAKNWLGAGVIAGIVLGFVAFVSAAVIYAILQKRRAQRMKHITQPFANWGVGDGEKDVAAPQMHGARWFSFTEIRKSTNQFSVENEIGEGGYGKVYTGVLASGERVAVKRAAKDSMQGAEEFKNEIELLSRVHHKNLVSLVGFCYDKGEQMLVYEFMANGTMREWLSGKKSYPLDWSKRLSIAIGSARGLAYLHEMANPPIVHRDVKSCNILLDDKHIAKVADFGLSKLAPDGEDTHMQTTEVKGTMGYLDPEYFRTRKLSEKSDVYSFGVVLLELLTSKVPISQGRYIVREMKMAYAEEGMEGLDPILDPSVHEASPQDLQRFLDLAFVCTEDRGDDRPTMNEVVKALEALAQHNKAKAKVSALATDETWLEDVYGDDAAGTHSQDHSTPSARGNSRSSFQYSGAFSTQFPEPK
ncbi:hypothetical protein KC19_3G189800 [Ceratodon purpureus]|uniref:non-specific serine/threonine protein kinase n=1 Tax=Ceratodon purpureus TaxID=3225 RepID=A0A8T0IK53_CERPU|nr:hypothetical protein KC19_3G189800 [Ceratodon purpureus]